METVCCICRRLRVREDLWVVVPPEHLAGGEVSHGYCPDCFRLMMAKTVRHGAGLEARATSPWRRIRRPEPV